MSTPEAALPGFPLARARAARRPREARVAFWGLMVFTFVLFVAPQNAFPALQPLALARSAVLVALAAYLINRAQTGQRLTVTTSPVRWALVLVLVVLLTMPTSFWLGGSMRVFLDLFGKSIVIFLLIANVIRSEARARLLVGSLLAWGVLSAIVALRNYATGDVLIEGGRIAGYDAPLALNPNDLALTLNILLGLAIGLLGTLRTRRARLLLVASMVVMAAAVVATFSRSGFVTLAVMVAFWSARSVRRRGVRVLFLLFPIALTVMLLLPAEYGERLATISDIEADTTGSAAERWDTMMFALGLIAENPLLGVGLGNNVHVSVHRHGPVMDAHNAYLKIGAEIGILGTIVFVALVVSAIRAARRTQWRLRRRPDARGLVGLAWGVELGLIAFAVGALFSPVPYHFYFYYPAGLAVALEVMARRLAAAVPPAPAAPAAAPAS